MQYCLIYISYTLISSYGHITMHILIYYLSTGMIGCECMAIFCLKHSDLSIDLILLLNFFYLYYYDTI